ncbi:SWIM-type domain-containing protein [Camponotus japonicus]
MPRTATKNLKCAGCDTFLKKITGKKKIVKNANEAHDFSSTLQRIIVANDILCKKCRLSIYKKKNPEKDVESETERDPPSESDNDDPTFEIQFRPKETITEVERIEIPIQRTVTTHKYCSICLLSNNLTTIPEEARISAYIKKKIYIPSGNRCCKGHLIKNRIYEDDLGLLRVHSNTANLTALELSKVIETLSIKCDSTLLDKVSEYSISEEQLEVFTGLNWENLYTIKDMLISLRNNYSNSIIKSFEDDVLPLRFGLNSLNRDDLIQNHTTEMAKKLFNINNNLFLICDGTYVRHQKSTNNEYQRKSFSGQKKVPLCKPFTLCTTDGYIVDMLGPYLANQNDAEILKSVIEDPNSLRKFLKEGDIFVLDRGFRDIKDILEKENFRVLMPALKGKRKQLSTEESNESRFVTKIRWAVESVHGVLKQKYRLLDHKTDNKLIPKIGSYFRIASFLNNTFGKGFILT